MHNPTRRVKRFNRPLSSAGPSHQPSETTDARFDVPGEDSPPPVHVRHRQVAQPDALRGAMLVALVVVTIVLYIILWELERSSFASVSKPNINQSLAATTSASSGSSETTWTQYPHAVAPDRPVFSSGQESNLSDNRTALSSSKLGRITWPPPIMRIPEEHHVDDPAENVQVDDRTHENETAKLASFDSAYCNGACRFLLPVRIGEQESKARVHFNQLLMLARHLNRTMVLPNVGKSRMNACSKWPFDAYYDTNEFAHKSHSPASWSTMNLEEFSQWINERPVLPTGFVVSMDSMPQNSRDLDVLGRQAESGDIPFIVEKAEVEPKILSCLEHKLARLRSSLPETALSISFHSGSLKTDSDASTRLVHLLSSSLDMDTDTDSDLDLMTGPGYEHPSQYINSSYLSLPDIDVLVLDYDLRHPLFHASVQPHFNLHYASVLYDLADRLADNLGPFLGVHWRMENVPVQNLAWCAASLVSTLHAFLQDDTTGKHVRHVWLATDHPRPLSALHLLPDVDQTTKGAIGNDKDENPSKTYAPLRKSSTFQALSSEHDDALGILTEAFQPGGDLDAWTLTDLAGQLRRYPYVEGRFDVNETLLGDPGLFGILDKLVIVQATVFVSGSTDCSKTSSFSKQVIEARQESFERDRGKGDIRNVVGYFGKW